MGNTTFSGPVRSESGFQTVSKNATTGAITVTSSVGTDTSPVVKGSGITGTGTIYRSSVTNDGGLITTTILVDLTGMISGAGTDDIIGGVGAANCHIGQIATAISGTPISIGMECLEAPAGGNTDINVYSATEATGVQDAAVSGLTSTLMINGAAQTLGKVTYGTVVPAANEYLYLTCGTATDVTFTAGKIRVTVVGYTA